MKSIPRIAWPQEDLLRPAVTLEARHSGSDNPTFPNQKQHATGLISLAKIIAVHQTCLEEVAAPDGDVMQGHGVPVGLARRRWVKWDLFCGLTRDSWQFWQLTAGKWLF